MSEDDQMYELIEAVSERAYAASWMRDAEFDVWRLCTEGGAWGMVEAEDEVETLNALLRLAGERGEWMRWSDGPSPIPLAEWRMSYRDWRNGPGYRTRPDRPTR